MMTISWYPGHMHRTRRELARLMGAADAVIEVLDARIPASSSNPLLARAGTGLPRIRILSKADLAEAAVSKAWRDWFTDGDNAHCLESSHDRPLSRQRLLATAARLTGRRSKGQSTGRPCQLPIVGVPNVGKSTLLNRLAGSKLARTGNEPALTRSNQRIPLEDGWYLVDTPGLMWPRLHDQAGAGKLAMAGCIRNSALEAGEVAWFAAEILLREFRPALLGRYELPFSVAEPEQLLEAIAQQRGCFGKGGRPDLHKAAEILLQDFRSGRLGRISLERPPV